jgi:thiol-disulfide isomerase/thioredoxin
MVLVLSVGCAQKTEFTYHINKDSTLNDFYGKPSVIVFGGTYCPHCRDAVPVFKEKVFEVYKEEVNIWVNVIDGKMFDVEGIPQGLNNNVDYNAITGEECNYVPSWLVMDAEGNVTLSSCGNEKEMSDMIYAIQDLIAQ